MSVQAMSWVFDHSYATGGPRHVLLVLANYANGSDPTEWTAYPGIHTIRRGARLSWRGAQNALRRLEEDGRIRPIGKSHLGTKVWRIVTDAEIDRRAREAEDQAERAAENREDRRRIKTGRQAQELHPAQEVRPVQSATENASWTAPKPEENQQRINARTETVPGISHAGDDLVDQVLAVLAEPLRAGHDVRFDPGGLGVAQIVKSRAAMPPERHLRVAHEAAQRLANPTWRTREAAQTLLYAWRDSERADATAAPAQSRATAASSRLEQKQARSARRRATKEAANGTVTVLHVPRPSVDGVAVEVGEVSA